MFLKYYFQGQREYIKCGRVFFTISVAPYVEGKEPTATEVALRIGAIVTTTVALGGLLGIGLVGGISGATSVQSVKLDGVYADGRMAVIRGRKHEDTGVYELYIHSLEYRK